MPFKAPVLSLASVPGGWRVLEDIEYVCRQYGVKVMIKANFFSDLASSPAIARAFISNNDHRIRLPALVHDWLYSTRGLCTSYSSYKFVWLNRREADNLFYYALRDAGVSVIKAGIMWLAVRAFGWRYWS